MMMTFDMMDIGLRADIADDTKLPIDWTKFPNTRKYILELLDGIEYLPFAQRRAIRGEYMGLFDFIVRDYLNKNSSENGLS